MSVGRVFQRAFSTIAHNPIVVLGLALLIGAIPSLAMTYIFTSAGITPTPNGINANMLPAFWGMIFVTGLVSVVISAIVQGALTRATVADSEGHHATFGECISAGLRVILPLIGVAILVGLGVMLGFILLIVPGVILLLMWSVAAPAVVVERDGVFQALGRSRELTRGARWKILGTYLVLAALYWLLSIILGLVGLKMYGAANAASGITTANLIGSVVLGTIFNVLWGTIQPSLYVELRHWKEGDSIQALHDVFA
jgi:hypothetical protein